MNAGNVLTLVLKEPGPCFRLSSFGMLWKGIENGIRRMNGESAGEVLGSNFKQVGRDLLRVGSALAGMKSGGEILNHPLLNIAREALLLTPEGDISLAPEGAAKLLTALSSIEGSGKIATGVRALATLSAILVQDERSMGAAQEIMRLVLQSFSRPAKNAAPTDEFS
jgi:hypothetical protein